MESDILDAQFEIVPLDDLTPTTNISLTEIKTSNTAVAQTPGEKILGDFEDSRKQIQGIVKIGAQAVEDLGALASQSQDPEHYTALSSLIKNVSEVASTLMKLHKQVEELKIKPNSQTVHTEKTEYHEHVHFVGSTAELSTLLKKNNE